MQEHTKAAFQAYSDLIKQLIALSTGVVGFVVAVAKLMPTGSLEPTVWTWVALGGLVASIMAGIIAIGRIIGLLDENAADTSDPILQVAGIAQQVLFLGAIVAIVLWLWGAAGVAAPPDAPPSDAPPAVAPSPESPAAATPPAVASPPTAAPPPADPPPGATPPS